MKGFKVLALALVAATCISANAYAAGSGFYAGVAGDLIIPHETDAKDNTGNTGTFSFNTGYGGGLVVGRKLQSNLRIEVEGTYRIAGISAADSNGTTIQVDSDVEITTGMANMFYDFDMGSSVAPYVGLGLGYSNVTVTKGTSGNTLLWKSDSDNVFSYQLALGLLCKLDKNWDLDLGYRYFGTQEANFDVVDLDFTSSNIKIGLNYNF